MIFSLQSNHLINLDNFTHQNILENNMNVDQHIKVAQWHLEQARLHNVSDHTCGCPANKHDQRAIDAVEAGLIIEEKACTIEAKEARV
jgi:hypothetical protein